MSLDHPNPVIKISRVSIFTVSLFRFSTPYPFIVFLDVWFFNSSFDSRYYTESSSAVKKNPKDNSSDAQLGQS